MCAGGTNAYCSKAVALPGLIANNGSDTRPPFEATQQRAHASLRFVNRLPDHASVAANGSVVFHHAAPGSVTGGSATRDTITTFTLPRGTTDTVRATTAAQLVNGSYYTVSATGGVQGSRVVLSVVRDNGPTDTTNVIRPAQVVTKP